MPELKQALLDRLHAHVGPLGFELSEQLFRRKAPWGVQYIHLAFRDRFGEAYDVNLDFAVRHNQLEELTFEPSPLISEDAKGEAASIGAELGNYLRGFPWTGAWIMGLSRGGWPRVF